MVPMWTSSWRCPGAGDQGGRGAGQHPARGEAAGRSPASSTCTPSASPAPAVAIVRFYVGEDEERSMVKLYNKLRANLDLIPPGPPSPSSSPAPSTTCRSWRSPSGASTLRPLHAAPHRRARSTTQIKAVTDVAETALIGGLRRQLRVTLDRERLAGLRRVAGRGGGGARRGEPARSGRALHPRATASTSSRPATSWPSAAEAGAGGGGGDARPPRLPARRGVGRDGPEEPSRVRLLRPRAGRLTGAALGDRDGITPPSPSPLPSARGRMRRGRGRRADEGETVLQGR